MSREQKVRSCLFYISVAVFLIGLPAILSFALGYKFNPRTLKFTKTGLIVLKTQPQGANVYLEGRLLPEKTPVTINELMPGSYNLKIELEGHYPWADKVDVGENKVMRLERIILFPLRPHIKQLNKGGLSYSWVDEKRKKLYYASQEDGSIYRSDMGDEHFEKVASLLEIRPPPMKWKVSPSGEKLLYCNLYQLAVVPLNPPNRNQETASGEAPFVLNYPEYRIIDAFWHSDSYHIVLVTNRNIEILEAKPNPSRVDLVTLVKKNTVASYDADTDTLYFLDYQKAPGGRLYDNLYKLALNAKEFPLQGLIKQKTDE